MEKRRLIAIVIALGALSLGLLTACGGGTDAAGTLGGEVTIGTGTCGVRIKVIGPKGKVTVKRVYLAATA